MSTSYPHTGGKPGAEAVTDYPYTVRRLRHQLDELGFRARAGRVGGEEVREMQARVAALRDSLEHGSQNPPPLLDDADDDHAARTRYYEQRIHAALADMASQLGDKHWSDNAPPGLDVASRAWLDQRFAALRDQLDDALAQRNPSADAQAALADTRARLNAMERTLAENAERQQQANNKILGLVDARIREAIAPDDSARLETLDQRLQSLQHGFAQAMGELDAMKTGTQRLAIRASATVARQTARATAHHVAKAVREAAPQHRFARLEEGLSGCMDETRTLRQEAGVIQQTLEEGLDDLRGRINELTLVTRKALAPQPAVAGDIAYASEWSAASADSYSLAGHARPTQRPRPRQPAQGASRAPARAGSNLISRLGLAVVVALFLAASFAMLYAQVSGESWRLPSIMEGREAPSSTSKSDKNVQPTPVRNEPEGRVILPGIILTGDLARQV